MLSSTFSINFSGNMFMNTRSLPGAVHFPLASQNKPEGHVPSVVPSPAFPPTVHAVER